MDFFTFCNPKKSEVLHGFNQYSRQNNDMLESSDEVAKGWIEESM